MTLRLLSVLLGILLTACAMTPTEPGPEVRKVLAPTGRLRVGVYLGTPTSMIRDPASGEMRGVTVELGAELARRLGVPVERVEFQRIAEILDAVKSGQVDFTVTNATAARAKEMDFTQPLLAIELGFLIPSGSAISGLADLDKPGVRVGVTQGSTSQTTLPRFLKSAAVTPAANIKVAIEMLSQGKLDAFATNKAVLLEMSDSLPGSRVLGDRWGLEQLAIAIPKGREQGMSYVRKFAAEAISEDRVGRAAERAGLRGSVKVESQ